MSLKFAMCAGAAALSLACFMGSASAANINNSYSISALDVGGVSNTSTSSPLIDNWVSGDYSGNVIVNTIIGASYQEASATGGTALATFTYTSSSWTDLLLVSGPSSGLSGGISISSSLWAQAIGRPGWVGTGADFNVVLTDVTSGQTSSGQLNFAQCPVSAPSCTGGTYDQSTTVGLAVKNGDILQLTGTLGVQANAQAPSTAGPTQTFAIDALASTNAFDITAGYRLTSENGNLVSSNGVTNYQNVFERIDGASPSNRLSAAFRTWRTRSAGSQAERHISDPRPSAHAPCCRGIYGLSYYRDFGVR